MKLITLVSLVSKAVSTFIILSVIYVIFASQQQKIISVCNWSRADERSAPSREVPMTKQLVTNLTETEGA